LGDGSAITTTVTHAFWVDEGASKPGWLEAGQLRVGDRLREADGAEAVVAGLRRNVGRAAVYTLTVAKDHTFFVGTAQVLVHNAQCFDIVPYRPASPSFINHHGILDAWAKAHIPGYVSRAAHNPTIAVDPALHLETVRVTNTWMATLPKMAGTRRVDWAAVSPDQVIEFSERLFDTLHVPAAKRLEYYEVFLDYIEYYGR